MATLSETAMVLKRLAAAFGQTITADQARAYHAVVGQYARMELAQAANDLMGEKTFFPRPAEVRAKIVEREIKGKQLVTHDPEDERCLWRMFELGINDPGELSEEDVRLVYGPIELFDLAGAA